MTTLKQRFAVLQSERPDISQADLARATNAKPPSVNAWFTGETKSMKPGTAAKAAALYGVDALWLATGEGYKTSTQSNSHPPDYKQNHALAPVQQAQAAINGVASLDQALDSLIAHLSQADAGTRAAAAGILAALANAPDNVNMRASLTALLTPAAFVEPSRKAA